MKTLKFRLYSHHGNAAKYICAVGTLTARLGNVTHSLQCNFCLNLESRAFLAVVVCQVIFELLSAVSVVKKTTNTQKLAELS